MEKRSYENYEKLSQAVAKRIIDKVKEKDDLVICLPSGYTPLKVFDILSESAHLFKNATFIGLDEWVGMDRTNIGSCQYYIYRDILSKIKFNKVYEFDAKSNRLQDECIKMDNIITTLNGIDIILLGLGINGHLGLNEPGCNFESKSSIVPLSDNTKDVAQKYFNLETSLEYGITLGINNILEAKEVLLMVSGEKKSTILKKVLESEVTNEIPATVLKKHSRSYIYTDISF